MTGLIAAGTVVAAAFAARQARHHAAARRQQEINEIDFADFDEPVVVTEQEVSVTDAELVPPEDYHPSQEPQTTAWEMPGRGAGPR